MLTRILANGIWTSRSALHCGKSTGETALSALDMVLTRDSEDRPFIPAASVIGAARSFAGRYLMDADDYQRSDTSDREPYREPPYVLCLFGSRAKYASVLSASDAVLMNEAHSTVRDGVRIDPTNGLAWADPTGGAKYNCEVLPAGARFQLAFELRMPDPLPPEATEADMLSVFGLVLQGFQDSEIRLGARTHRGYGSGSVESWSIRRIKSPSHYVDWLKRDAGAGEALTIGQLAPSAHDRRRPFEIEASFLLKTSLLVRSGGNKSKDPDCVHLTEGGSAILPGTSLAGVLRHRCERIANTLCPPRASALITGMFGPLKNEGERGALRASRVCVDETALRDGSFHVHTRVAIDRFTQGALETALFEEAPFWPNESTEGHFRGLRLTLQPPRHDEAATRFGQEVGLLLMAFKDLWLGDLAVGGGVAAGRGVLQGLHAVFRHADFGSDLAIEVRGSKVGAVQRSGPEAGWRKIEQWCQTWHKERE